MPVTDPALRFWLRYATREGALWEEGAQASLVVLPQRLAGAFSLPEEVLVTSDPEVAREDGATLIAPGHPALDQAADAILTTGDAGRLTLAWPTRVPPGADTLLAHARDRFPVDHGRLDAAGPPRRVLLPVLRVGALVHFDVSMESSFQERMDCWVDGRSGLEITDGVWRALAAQSPEADDTPAASRPIALPPDLVRAVREAYRLIDARAAVRSAVIAKDAEDERAAEIRRVERYYSDALASIARRRATAGADRVAMLDARAEATRAERVRRLAEIEDKHRSRIDIRPIRLHVVEVPALELPVDVLRGPRRYPLLLHWMFGVSTFARVRCPSCGEPAPLVAAKDRLGCERCLPSRVPAHHPPQPPAPASAPAPAPASASRGNGALRTAPVAAPGTAPPAARAAKQPPAAPPSTARPSVTRPSAGQPSATQPSVAQRSAARHGTPAIRVDGGDFTARLWRAVATADRATVRTLVAPESPLGAAIRLFGPLGALYAAEIPPGEIPTEMSVDHLPTMPEVPEVTTGVLRTAHRQYTYSLRWGLEGRRPVAYEVLPYFGAAAGPRLLGTGRWGETRQPSSRVPSPLGELDPVAAAIWRTTLPATGLALALRCLAAWWRAGELPALAPCPAPVVAAAVTRMVSWRSGLRSSTDVVAAGFGVEADRVRNAERPLQRTLQLSRLQTW
ncbi:hypothetical protein [Frankia sp. CiP1_Cm_nod1]|uniref:hypothetical protein n=1 Tax=Frankia sp. CiP1_Cm_nod1 TaxID=2897160 RepID=UPI0020252555